MSNRAYAGYAQSTEYMQNLLLLQLLSEVYCIQAELLQMSSAGPCSHDKVDLMSSALSFFKTQPRIELPRTESHDCSKRADPPRC
jgi:hypothetical protein